MADDDNKNILASRLEEALENEGLTEDKANDIISSMFLARSEYYSGPIPSAEELEKYEKILPNAADRIISMAEVQGEHRRKLEESTFTEETEFNKRGQLFGFIISLLILVVAIVAIITGQGLVGLGAILVGIVSVIISFYMPKPK